MKKWEKKEFLEIAKGCKNKNELLQKYPNAYHAGWRNKWLDEAFQPNQRKEQGFWGKKENCIALAIQFETRSKLKKAHPYVYKTILKNGWSDECGWKKSNMPPRYWTKERCIEEGKKYDTLNGFRKGCPSAYMISVKNGWAYELFDKPKKKRKDYWTKERCIEEASKYNGKREFHQRSSSAYCACIRNGWLDECVFSSSDINVLIDNDKK